MLIDHQTHYHPRAFFEALIGRSGFPHVTRDGDGYLYHVSETFAEPYSFAHVDLDDHIAGMDTYGVDIDVISPVGIGEALFLDRGQAVDSLDALNAMMAEAQRSAPDRLRALAVLPVAYPDAAVDVLDRAIGEQGLSGVCLFSSVNGRPAVTEALLPIFERVAELGVPLFLHPATQSSVYSPSATWAAERGLGWMYDTSLAAVGILQLGVFDRFPDITIVHPHAGGVLPYVLGRVGNAMRRGRDPELPSLADQLRTHFYVDTVTPTPGAVTMALQTYGPGRVLFATDHPWQQREAMLRYLEDNVDNAAQETIRRATVRWGPRN